MKITCFNDICGSFKDEVVVKVKGLPDKRIPTVAEVEGSPILVLPYQLGMSYKGEWSSYMFGTYMRNSPKVKREFKISNSGPKDVIMEWKMFDLDEKKEKVDFFNVRIADPRLGSE